MKESEFEEVYRIYSDTAFGAAFRLVRNTQIAEDITQEVFIRLFARIDTIDRERVAGWVRKVAVRLVYDYQKSARVQHEFPADEVREDSSDTMNPERILIRQELSGMKDKVLDALFQKDVRDYLIMYKVEFEERPQEEVAAELGITLNTLRVRLHRSKKWLKKVLGDEARELGLF